MDPLSQLRDIHLPDPVGFWPLAPGWWILLVMLLGAVIFGISMARKQRRRSAPRRHAIRELEHSYNAFIKDKNSTDFVIKINILLKKFSVNYYDKASVSKLTGDAWLEFLDQSSSDRSFSNGPGASLASGPYSPSVDIDADGLKRACKQWISSHD